MTARSTAVAIVGGGPAGAILAVLLARRGIETTLLERAPSWRWRAGGVFASPIADLALARIGLDAAARGRVARRIPSMRLETEPGPVVRLTYGAEIGWPAPVGFDRSALDPALLAMAVVAGADVVLGSTVTEVDRGTLTIAGPHGRRELRARIVVGADGAHSSVARAVGVARPVRARPRVGLSYHLPDPRGDEPLDARLIVLRDGYIGIAPVPGGRVNVGIVLGPSWGSTLRTDGAGAVARRIVRAVPATPDDLAPWRDAEPCEPVAGAWPLGGRVTRRAGPGWFLVGDAAGFLDPFTGEGIHRAIVSAELAAPAIAVALRDGPDAARAAAAYDRAMRRRFLAKDALSWLLGAFLERPPLFRYAARRVAGRDDVRATMGLVMGDLIPAGRALDPRFLAAVLRP
jgi:menaquinone-9 beta-reductase